MAEESDSKSSSNTEERGVFDFADGGRYIGEWSNGGANGYGICVGPVDSGLFQGKWINGCQCSGVFRWSNGQRYLGTWKDGTRHGVGKEIRPDGSEYTGDFHDDTRGPYGALKMTNGGGALYQGTWEGGLHDGVGVEVYTDKGVYKGQYKKGFRNGYGTRSSYGYELFEKKHNLKTDNDSNPGDSPKRVSSFKRPGLGRPPMIQDQSLSRSCSSTSIAMRDHRCVSASSSIQSEGTEMGRQIYEGQWYKDKRHGHGVMRAPGSYMYCGEWSFNNRTGNGILIYEDGRREEGVWENGQLVIPLKRKTFSIKYRQLEVKVKQAHTLALQAADVARTKALLAESRASAASSRAKLGIKAAKEAEKDADIAKEKAEELYNMEHQQKELTTPTMGKIMDFNTSSDSLDTTSLLSVPGISPTPSLENLHNYARGNSNEYTEKKTIPDYIEKNPSIASLNPSMSDSGIFINVESNNEAESVLRNENQSPLKNEIESFIKNKTEPSFRNGIEPSSKNDADLSSPIPVLQRRASVPAARRRSSLHKLEKQATDPFSAIEQSETRQRRLTQIDHTTGEIVTVFTDELNDSKKPDSILTARHTARTENKISLKNQQEQTINVDMLKQMANWNRMIAYINFILLLFLLLLIVFVVAFLSTTITQNNPTQFMNPMA